MSHQNPEYIIKNKSSGMRQRRQLFHLVPLFEKVISSSLLNTPIYKPYSYNKHKLQIFNFFVPRNIIQSSNITWNQFRYSWHGNILICGFELGYTILVRIVFWEDCVFVVLSWTNPQISIGFQFRKVLIES